MRSVFQFRDTLIQEYASFSRSFTRILADDIASYVGAEYERARYWPEPLIQINPNYLRAKTVDELVEEGSLHPMCGKIFRYEDRNGNSQPIRLFNHQQEEHYIRSDKPGHRPLEHLVSALKYDGPAQRRRFRADGLAGPGALTGIPFGSRERVKGIEPFKMLIPCNLRRMSRSFYRVKLVSDHPESSPVVIIFQISFRFHSSS